MRSVFTLLFALAACSAYAQEIAGIVVDNKKEPVINATVNVYMGDIQKGGTITDYDGNYVLKPLDGGTYDVVVSMPGYDSVLVTGVIVSIGNRTVVNYKLSPIKAKAIRVVVPYWRPLSTDGPKLYFPEAVKPKAVTVQDKTENKVTRCGDRPIHPITQVTDLVATPACGITNYQRNCGPGVSIGGARSQGTIYVVDSVMAGGDTQPPYPLKARTDTTKYIIDGVVIYSLPIMDVVTTTPEFYSIPGHYTYTSEAVSHMPASKINDLPQAIPGIYQPRRGDALSVYGGRPEGNLYIIDGVWQR